LQSFLFDHGQGFTIKINILKFGSTT
jgi:hypothetical protein